MKKPLKIYLGDLTYNTVSLSTETFPLNIGFVASYCISRFGDDVQITLFKYIDELDKAINESPPDILGMSNYAWCHRISKEMFRMAREKNPSVLNVWGGPNFPVDLVSQEKFMKKHSEIDVYVPTEGETGFSNIVERYLSIEEKEMDKEKFFEEPIDGCITRKKNGEPQYSNPVIRIDNLNQIPSPYTTGLLDKFFDGKLCPIIQTNRGCPFTCTFCTDGSDIVKQVNKFSVEHVKEELEYIGNHLPKNIHTLYISDLNFGMIPQDLKICEVIRECQEKYSYPKRIQATTGKNRKEAIIEAIKLLSGSLLLTMSVQSMDEQILQNIRRANISTERMLALSSTIKETNLNTTSEVILGLPGETYDTHIQTLRDLISAKIDYVQGFTLMLLDGSELNTPREREKWGFKTKFRILPKDFAKLSNGKNVVEIEEVVVGSNTLSFEEYVELRVLVFIIQIGTMGIVYEPLLKLMREKQIDIFELFFKMLKNKQNAPEFVQDALTRFEKGTINELWDTPEQIEQNYQNEEEYKKLINGDEGINLIQFYRAVVTAEGIDDWTEYMINTSKELFEMDKKLEGKIKKQFEEVANYCRGLSHNPLKEDRMKTNPKFAFNYNIKNWLKDTTGKTIEEFKLVLEENIEFKLTEEQYNIVQDNLELFGNTSVGRGQVLKRVPVHLLWRKPIPA